MISWDGKTFFVISFILSSSFMTSACYDPQTSMKGLGHSDLSSTASGCNLFRLKVTWLHLGGKKNLGLLSYFTYIMEAVCVHHSRLLGWTLVATMSPHILSSVTFALKITWKTLNTDALNYMKHIKSEWRLPRHRSLIVLLLVLK